jgi:cell division protein FtsB
MEGKKITLYLVIFATLMGLVFLPGLSRLHRLRRENEELQKRMQLLQEQNDLLQEEIVTMQQDPGYVEKKAREKLGVLKKGEIVYKPSSKR